MPLRSFFKIICFFLPCLAFSQDIHFTQFYASPLSLNPALTGKFDGDWRMSNIYRTQWKEVTRPYNSLGLSLDKQFFLYNEHLSGGLLFINDRSGSSLKVNKISLSAAYHKRLLGYELDGGIQFGFVSKTLNSTDLTFPNQLNWDLGQFDSKLPNYEKGLNNSLSYFDLNAGFAVSRKIKNIEPLLGLSFFHLNMPKESFFERNNFLNARYVAHAEVKWDLSPKLFVVPRLLYMKHTSASELVGGSTIHLILKDGKGIIPMVFGGICYRDGWNRNSDAVMLIGGLRYKKIDLGLSYDINISSLHVASNYRGSFEVSLIYISPSSRLKKIAIPCERF